jgi:hypothetical protein
MRIGIGEPGEADEPRDIIDRFASVGQQLASLEPERESPQVSARSCMRTGL